MIPPLSREEIAAILDRNRGSKTLVARRARVLLSTVSGWLAGKTTSENIATSANRIAFDLLHQEEKNARANESSR